MLRQAVAVLEALEAAGLGGAAPEGTIHAGAALRPLQADSPLHLALDKPAWTPASHQRFPRRFKAASRALLLAAHASRSAPDGSATLGDLPTDVVLLVVGAAAYPLATWL